MAKQIWSDQALTLTLSGKCKDNTGISSVDVAASNGGFVGAEINPTETTFSATSISNKAAGVTTASAFSLYVSPSGANSAFNTTFQVNWAGKSTKSDIHTIEVEVRNAVNAANITPSVSAADGVWNDALGYMQVTYSTANGKSPYVEPKTANATFSSAYVNVASNGDITAATDREINGSATADVTATWAADTVANSEITSHVQYTIKNAVKEVVTATATNTTLSTDAKTIYVPVGQTQQFTYTVNPLVPGKAYSYALAVAIEGGTASDIQITSSSACTSESVGTVNISGKTVGTYNVTFTSNAASAPKTSNPVTIVVTPAALDFAINCGDTVTIASGQIPVGTTITAGSNGLIGAAPTSFPYSPETGIAILTGLDSNGKVQAGTDIVIYASSKAGTLGTAKWAMSGGAEITVSVSHITLSLD